MTSERQISYLMRSIRAENLGRYSHKQKVRLIKRAKIGILKPRQELMKIYIPYALGKLKKTYWMIHSDFVVDVVNEAMLSVVKVLIREVNGDITEEELNRKVNRTVERAFWRVFKANFQKKVISLNETVLLDSSQVEYGETIIDNALDELATVNNEKFSPDTIDKFYENKEKLIQALRSAIRELPEAHKKLLIEGYKIII